MDWSNPETLKKWKPIAFLLLTASVLGAIGSLTNFYGKAADWMFSKDLSLQGLELCLYDQCVNDNEEFVSIISGAVGQSVEIDVIFDVPLGVGDYNVRCISEIPYLYAPEGTYYLPQDLGECDIKNGIIFQIPLEDQIQVAGVSFTQKIRIKGTYSIAILGPEPRYALIRE